jgi:Xaa-Pro aminopeptidase
MHTTDERACNPLPLEELRRRWNAVRSAMHERQLDALVVQNSNDWLGGYVRWFTGAPATNAYPRSVVFPAAGDMSTVGQGPFDGVTELKGDDPGAPGVGRQLHTPSYVSAGYTATYDADLVLDELRRGGCRRVGMVAPASMYYGFGTHLAQSLAKAGTEVADATELIDALKAVKSPYEQQMIASTAAMQDEVLAKVCQFIRPGMQEFEVAAYAQYVGQTLGSEQGIFIGSGAPAGQPAMFRPRSQQGRALRKGDAFTLLLENNGSGGYYTELLRPIILGKATTEQRDAWALLLEAQRFTLERLKPGSSCREIFAQYNEFLRSRGMGEEKRLHCHGQGYDMVERPLIRRDETMDIRPGMNIVVHPGFKSAGVFMTIVDNYLIGAQGPGECLHRTPKSIIELEV